jgi:hypothetical protein
MRIASLLAALSIGICSAAEAVEPVWHWIWVVPSADPKNGWSVFEGETPVRFDGANLDLTISTKGDDGSPELHVQGRVTGHNVHSTVTQLGTDASPERYVGSYSRVRTRLTDAAQGWGEDRIALRCGPSFLSLYRRVPPAP